MNGVQKLIRDKFALAGVAAAAILGAVEGLVWFAERGGASPADAFDAACGLLGFGVLLIPGVHGRGWPRGRGCERFRGRGSGEVAIPRFGANYGKEGRPTLPTKM